MNEKDDFSLDRMRRAAVIAAVAVPCGAMVPIAARAQSAARRVLCHAGPGSTPDVIARGYASRLSAIVENRAGASGLLAVAALLQAQPDGNTMLLGHAELLTLYPFLFSRLPYDAALDLVPVSLAAETTLAFAVGPAVPASVLTLRDYVEWARAHPQRAIYGSPGVGTVPHVLGAAFAKDGKFEALHVPYAGGPPAVVDLVAGRVASLLLPDGLLRPMREAGKLRLLATTGLERSAATPGVPTVTEEGYPRLTMRAWFGFFMPRGTPATTVEAAASAIGAAASDAGLVAALGEAGLQPLASGPREVWERIARDRRSWADIISTTGIRLD